MSGMYRLFCDKDLSIIEVNPLIIDKQQNLLALDAKINADDNALFRHPDLAAMRDEAQEIPPSWRPASMTSITSRWTAILPAW